MEHHLILELRPHKLLKVEAEASGMTFEARSGFCYDIVGGSGDFRYGDKYGVYV